MAGRSTRSLDSTMSRFRSIRRSAANALLVMGAFLLVLAPYAAWSVWSGLAMVGGGIGLFLVSFAVFPYRSWIPRYRAAPVLEPSHIARAEPKKSHGN